MASNSDSSGKSTPKGGADAGARKPSAILDLKPTQVGIRDLQTPASDMPGAKPGEARPTAAGAASKAYEGRNRATAATGSGATGSSATGSSPAAGAGKPTAAPAGSATGSQPAATAGPGSGTGTGSGSGHGSGGRDPAPAPAPRRSGSGLWSTITHLAAGIVGGGVMLYGADALVPMLGLPPPPKQQVDSSLAQRLAALEQSSQASPAATRDLAQKLAATQQQIGALAEIGRTTQSLAEKQAVLATELKALSERPAQAGNGGDAVVERVTRLESTLQSLASTASQTPGRGGVAQMAAISGRIADLETSLANQLAALRKSVGQEVDSRLGQSTEASEAARAGTQRIDRELAGVKTEQARLAQRVDELKAGDDRLAQSIDALKDSTVGVGRSIGAVKTELEKVARPQDVAKALEPVASRVAGLERSVAEVVRSETDRRANAERIVVALELGNLKRTVERGAPFGPALNELKKLTAGKLDLSALDRYKDTGVPTTVELADTFRQLAHRIIEAEAVPVGGNWGDRLLAGAKSIVKVRRTAVGEGETGAEAIVARIEKRINEERLTDVVAEAGKLSPEARKPAGDWLQKVEARASVDRAISRIESELKSSLAKSTADGKKG